MSIELQAPNKETISKQPHFLNSEENLLINPNNKPSNEIQNGPPLGGFPKEIPPWISKKSFPSLPS